jgi:hypothetical protein
MSIASPDKRIAAAVQLSHVDGEKQVCVTPKDHDRFALKVDIAIELLKEGIGRERFANQLKVMMRQLSDWIVSHDSEVSRAYLTMRDESLCFLVERKSPRYDADFEDALSDLDIQISDDSDLEGIELYSMAIPPVSDSALESFLHPKFQIRFDR